MDILSRRQATLEHGLCLETTLDGAVLTVYVMLGDADLESIPAIVPPELVEAGAAIHAAGVDDVDQAQEQIDQVLENVSPGDVAVFFCADENSFGAALDLLGLPIDD
ncbi:hypothetical protein [Bordetella genomosp. 13]|uniref:hypothetical protein n=1 Tax=Bordetella genomosp. 13 TaxID=463040 RepID=UPI0011A4E94E|nr:hypothetical protein [Bordetella genomosp. 13]